MVDIDGRVVELSKRYLPEWSAGAFDDARARVDRRRRAARSCATTAIATASSSPISPSRWRIRRAIRSSTTTSFALIKSRLADGGVYVLQASTAGVHNAALHCKMARTLRRHYEHVASFYTHVPAFDTDWAFLACSDRVDLARLEPRAIESYCATLAGEASFTTRRRTGGFPKTPKPRKEIFIKNLENI